MFQHPSLIKFVAGVNGQTNSRGSSLLPQIMGNVVYMPNALYKLGMLIVYNLDTVVKGVVEKIRFRKNFET